MLPLASILLAFSVAQGEPIQATQVRAVARVVHAHTTDSTLALAASVVGWRESRFGRYGHRAFGCYGVAPTLDAQAACAVGTVGSGFRRCGAWDAALSYHHHGDRDCRVDGYGRAAARQLAWMLGHASIVGTPTVPAQVRP